MKVKANEIWRMLGEENDAALECLWSEKGWDEEVDLGEFLREWTDYVENAARFAERNGIED